MPQTIPPDDLQAVDRVTAAYTANSIRHMTDVEHVRHLPDMYIGDTGSHGLHHLIHEVVNNSIDEVLAGYATDITITLHADNSVSVADNGRGIPTDINTSAGVSGVELAMTNLKAGGKFGDGGYEVSGGLHGVGLSCVNFLSQWCEATIRQNGREHHLRCERGVAIDRLRAVGDAELVELAHPVATAQGSGTTIHWLADPDIFGAYRYDIDEVIKYVRNICYLAPSATITLVDEGASPPIVMKHPRGIVEFVDDLNAAKQPIGDIIMVRRDINKETEEPGIEIAFQYSVATHETLLSFANLVHTKEGGTHVVGFRGAISRVVNQYARKTGVLKEGDENFTGEDVRESLTAVISVRVQRPQFESNTKVKLNNASVEKAVAATVSDGVARYFEEHPQSAKAVIDRVLISQRARIAAQKAVSLMKRQSGLDSASLPGKLADCLERDPRRSEIFLVEGDSAGGSAKGGRDRRHQAILPLRGKILNVDKAALGRILDNNEVRSLISALGTGIDTADDADLKGSADANSKFDIGKLRYHRVIIMTDADVDGSHIRTLLLTFFYRYMRPLLERGHVYLALPPLYSVRAGKNVKRYVASQTELETVLKELKKADCQVGRFKGLGEMNADELYETTMNPATRRLAKVTMDDAAAADSIFSILMSDRVEPRKQFIIRYAKETTQVDWHC